MALCLSCHACLPSLRGAASCQIYDALVFFLAGTSGSGRTRQTNTSPKPTTGPLPWLYYQVGVKGVEDQCRC
jgi:hypothetical protein